MKKYYGNDVVEYYDGENHYYFDNNNMTYWKSDIPVNTSLYIDISIIDGMENIVKNGKISNFEILKFIILKDDLRVIDYDFREKRYHVINCKSESILLDKDTFYAERIIQSGENYKYREPTEYRVRTANVGWREIQEPDFSKYKFIEK